MLAFDAQAAEMAAVREEAIVVTLPDGKTFDGLAWKVGRGQNLWRPGLGVRGWL